MISFKKFKEIKPEKLKLGGLIGKRFDITMYKNLFCLDMADDFLKPFQRKDKTIEYMGLGKNIDAMVKFNYYNLEPQLTELLNSCINALSKSQMDDGYIGMYLPEYRYSKPWDLHETSYIILSLVSHYNYSGSHHSLEVAIKAADCILENLTSEVVYELKNHAKALDTPVHAGLVTLGFERAFLHLYQATGNTKYFDAVKIFGIYDWDLDIVLTRKDGVEGHAYAYFTRCLTQLELYELTGNQKLLSQTERLIDFLLHEGGMVVTGACSIDECWHNDQSGDGNLGETCATAYYLRLLSKLIELRGEGKYGDIMERIIYNTLFAAQSPDGRKIRYYTPFEGDREYYFRDTYCCPNNYRRIIAELPEMICYNSANGILINLYTESQLDIHLRDETRVTIKQTTDYPENGTVKIELNADKKEAFTVYLRIPGWCSRFDMKINGMDFKNYSLANGIAAVNRTWRKKDNIQLNFAMPFRTVRGFCRQEGKVAILRGPLLFCFNPYLNPDIPLATLSSWIIDPKTFSIAANYGSDLEKISCRVHARNHDQRKDLLLTPFPDPEGKAIYLRSLDLETAIDDELLQPKDHSLWRKVEKGQQTGWNGQ